MVLESLSEQHYCSDVATIEATEAIKMLNNSG